MAAPPADPAPRSGTGSGWGLAARAGWYQVRKALEAYGESELTDFEPFKAAYKSLGDKLRPMVFELGFLPG